MTILYLTSRARYFRDLSKIYYIRTLSLVVVIKDVFASARISATI